MTSHHIKIILPHVNGAVDNPTFRIQLTQLK